MRIRLFISLVLFCIGNVLIILAFQLPEEGVKETPEWAYDLFSIGLAIFMAAPFLMIMGLCCKFTNWYLSIARVPAALGSFFTLFNAGKEVTGLNNDYSTAQLVVFLIGMALTLIIQYEYHRKHIGE